MTGEWSHHQQREALKVLRQQSCIYRKMGKSCSENDVILQRGIIWGIEQVCLAIGISSHVVNAVKLGKEVLYRE